MIDLPTEPPSGRTHAGITRLRGPCGGLVRALVAFGMVYCAVAASPPPDAPADQSPSSGVRPLPIIRSSIARRMIPFQKPEVAVSSNPADVAAIRALGRSEQEAERTAHALAMCDAWLRRHVPCDADVSLDRQALLSRLAKARNVGPDAWSVEATAALVATATTESLGRLPLTVDQLAIRDEQRRRVCEAVVETIALIERESGVSGFSVVSGSVEGDVRRGFDKLLATPWACIGQVPVSPSLFDELMSTIEEVRAQAVVAAVTELGKPVAKEDMPNIAASAVADVLMDAVFDYARVAFLDGFAGRGSPLPFYGFAGGVSGRFSNIHVMPSGELPEWRPAGSGSLISEAPAAMRDAQSTAPTAHRGAEA